ncbi:PTS sugar transporter subunit IIB [Psychrobacillus sp. FJAT-51614]|uniref:PTS sugar transporter subunit IIB n=1 Tax=Psychrobacillus mangrovi TaxID=3117745 RepID=A0ABU8FAD1_9BACI
MKILLCCAAGMSTSLLVRKLQSFVSNDKKAYFIKAMDQDSAELHLKNFDVVLIGPQIRYALPRLKKIAQIYEIPVEVIDPTDYGRNNVGAILAFAEHLFSKKKAKLD